MPPASYTGALPLTLVLGSWGNTMRGAVRNTKRGKGRRTPTQILVLAFDHTIQYRYWIVPVPSPLPSPLALCPVAGEAPVGRDSVPDSAAAFAALPFPRGMQEAARTWHGGWGAGAGCGFGALGPCTPTKCHLESKPKPRRLLNRLSG